MPPLDDVSDWLGDLRWQGYPRLESRRAPPAAHRPRKAADARVEALARENEALRAKIETLVGLVSEFERRLSEAASSYEGAALENDSARRRAELERERLAGELQSAQAEFRRTQACEATRESAFVLERERRADCEKVLLEARRRLNDLEAELAKTRGKASELEGAAAELRRLVVGGTMALLLVLGLAWRTDCCRVALLAESIPFMAHPKNYGSLTSLGFNPRCSGIVRLQRFPATGPMRRGQWSNAL